MGISASRAIRNDRKYATRIPRMISVAPERLTACPRVISSMVRMMSGDYPVTDASMDSGIASKRDSIALIMALPSLEE